MNMEESKAQVSARHKEEWRRFRQEFFDPMYQSGDLDAAKIAKGVADVLKISQEGERKAWGFADGETADAELKVGWEDSAE